MERGRRSNKEPAAVRVYTVCDESRYLLVRNVPALGCINELIQLFGTYGHIEEYLLLDDEDAEPYTDVYWIRFADIADARTAKRSLDEFQFLGNLLQVNYAPKYETLWDTKQKLEARRLDVLNRKTVLRDCKAIRQQTSVPQPPQDPLLDMSMALESIQKEPHLPESVNTEMPALHNSDPQHVTEESLNATVQHVREKLNKLAEPHPMQKKPRRRI